MRKDFIAILLLAAVCLSPLSYGQETLSTENTMENGSIQTYVFGDMRLHAYQTGDALSDECFALETTDSIIAIESPAFDANIEEWKNYLAGLNKPLTDVLLSFHPTGGKWYGNAISHATESAQNAITNGATKQLVDTLKGAFGDTFNNTISNIDSILVSGRNTIGGIDIEINNDGDGYDIAIPAINTVYMHMLGANVHSILVNPDHMNATIAKLEEYKKKGYTLFLSSHHTPETVQDVDAKIDYIRNVKNIGEISTNRADFVQRMKEEYPTYAGENYLGMTAEALFIK